MKIVIIGNYGARNAGDEAVLAGMLQMIREQYKDANITVLSYNPKDTKRGHHIDAEYLLPFGVRSFLKLRLLHTLRVLKQADVVLVGGGALFTDEKMKAMNLWGFHVRMAARYCEKVVLFANTIGPLRTEKGRGKMKKILSFVESVSVRDKKSEQLIHELDKEKKVIVASDPAFVLNKNIIQQSKKQIVVNLRPWIHGERDIIKIISGLCNELTGQGYSIILLPFQTFQDDDRKVLRKVYDQLLNKNSVQLITQALGLHETMKLIGESEMVIGMRLHSLIFSIIQHVPFIALSYSDKISSMMKDIGMEEYCVDINKVTHNGISSLVKDIAKNKEDIENKLKKESEDMRNKAYMSLKCLED